MALARHWWECSQTWGGRPKIARGGGCLSQALACNTLTFRAVARSATHRHRARRPALWPRARTGARRGIIQLYPLPFIYTVRSDLCEHLPTCGSAAIVRNQYSHCALVKQGGALCSPRENLQLIGQSVPKRQPPEVLMTLDREFES